MSEWIPVEVELPKKNKGILIQGKCNGMYVGKYMGEKLGFRIWSDENGYKEVGCVAWMYLPKPYKKENKND